MTDLGRDISFLAHMMVIHPSHVTEVEQAYLQEIAERYPRLAPNQDVEEVEPTLGEQTGPAPSGTFADRLDVIDYFGDEEDKPPSND